LPLLLPPLRQAQLRASARLAGHPAAGGGKAAAGASTLPPSTPGVAGLRPPIRTAAAGAAAFSCPIFAAAKTAAGRRRPAGRWQIEFESAPPASGHVVPGYFSWTEKSPFGALQVLEKMGWAVAK